MDIAILILVGCVFLLLIAIFAVIIVKNKGNKPDIDRILQDVNDRQKEEIVERVAQNCKTENSSMLDELSRSNSGLSTTLTNTIASNNSTLTNTITTNNDLLNKTFDKFRESQDNKYTSLEKNLVEQLKDIHTEVTNSLYKQKVENTQNNSDIKEMIANKFVEIDKAIAQELEKVRKENQEKLDSMRGVVEEKLQNTLDTKINESFKLISEQLQAVSKGLGEMSNLTTGVDNLNKIMSNVKTRGMWGEISLNTLLEQILTTDQYEKQLSIKGREMVDFAVLLPGKKEDEKVYLPIDAKFPLADYQNLVDASESYNKEQVELAKKNLFKRIKEEAKSISTKYIDVPNTTNFAIMYLPIEGLFAEVVKDATLLEELQTKYNVVVSGPTTITALLNSLQLGFKTLQIQKSSTEVWKALSKFKTEFDKFAFSLDKVKKQANTVVTTIEDTSKKTEKIKNMLGKLDGINSYQTQELLEGGEDNDGEESDN